MTLIVRKHFGVRRRGLGERSNTFWWKFCLTSKMSHDYGWRGSCAAGGVTAMVVGSGALLGVWFGEVGRRLMCLPSKHSTVRTIEHWTFFFFDRRRPCGSNLP